MNITQVVQVFKALLKGPVSRADLAKLINVQPKTIGKLLAEMKEQKLIRVLDYENQGDGRNRVKLYAIGDGTDADPRASQSQENRSRKSYLRKMAANNAFTPRTTFVGGRSIWQ